MIPFGKEKNIVVFMNGDTEIGRRPHVTKIGKERKGKAMQTLILKSGMNNSTLF